MKTAIGIDIGGTKIKACLADEQGRVLKEMQVLTRAQDGRDAVLTQLDEIAKALMREDTIGGGIGSPGIIDPESRRVAEFGFNIEGWRGTCLTERLQEMYPDLAWHADNDANCAALGEYWVGAGRGLSSFIMITLGTGVGGAIFERGELHHGHYAEAGELGHMIFMPEGRTCNCGQHGCIEKYVSGGALKALYEESTGSPPKGSIFMLAESDDDARDIVEQFKKNLAYYFVTLKQAFDPEAFIIGGGLIHERDIWWEDFERHWKSSISFTPKTKLLAAERLNEAGMLGAAYLVIGKESTHGTQDSSR